MSFDIIPDDIITLFLKCFVEILWGLFETWYSDVYGELYQLEDHADWEPDPDPDWATEGGNEGDQGVARWLGDALHVQWHEVHVHPQVVILHILGFHLI